MARVIVLDASVLIAFLDGADQHHAAAEALLAGAVDDDLAVSTLTLAEVLVVPARTGQLDAVLAVLAQLEVEASSFPPDAAVRLAGLRARTGLKMPDCCVLLCAEELSAGLASFDTRLVRAARERGLDVLPR